MDNFLPSFEWHHTAEGETFLQHLYNGRTSGRKLFGILEKPFQSSNLEEVCYKLVFVGKTGAGKTSTINKVAGISAYSSYFETSGIRITDIYWPVKVWDKIILFKLQCWDAGSSCMKKYNHIPSSCVDNADFFVFIFSFNDAQSFNELPLLINKFVTSRDNQPGSIVIGTRNMLKTEVMKSEIKDFESKQNIEVLTIQNSIYHSGPYETVKVAPLLNTICEKLWMRDQQYILKQGIKV